MGAQIGLKDIVIRFVDYVKQNGQLKILIWRLLKKISVEGGLDALQFFGRLKIFIFQYFLK